MGGAQALEDRNEGRYVLEARHGLRSRGGERRTGLTLGNSAGGWNGGGDVSRRLENETEIGTIFVCAACLTNSLHDGGCVPTQLGAFVERILVLKTKFRTLQEATKIG